MQNDKDEWLKLVRKTRKSPVKSGRLVTTFRPDGIELSPPWTRCAPFIGLLMIAFIAAVWVELKQPPMLLRIAIWGAVVILAGLFLYECFRHDSIVLNTWSRQLSIYNVSLFSPRSVTVSTEQIEAQLVLTAGDKPDAKREPTRVVLYINKSSDPGSRVRVAKVERRHEILPFFEHLQSILGSDFCRDATFPEVPSSAHETIYASGAPISKGGPRFRHITVLKSGAHRMQLRPTRVPELFWLLLGTLTAGLAVCYIISTPDTKLMLSVLGPTILGLITLLYDYAGFTHGLWVPTVVADKAHALLSLKPTLLSFDTESIYDFDQILAVQLCSYICKRRSYMVIELNLALADPPGERLHLFAHANEKAMRKDSKTFADFIGKPLLDHTTTHAGSFLATKQSS